VNVEVGDLPGEEEVVQGREAAELEGTAGHRAAGEDERQLRVALACPRVALLDDGDAHWPWRSLKRMILRSASSCARP
jgi:hypothetical protein